MQEKAADLLFLQPPREMTFDAQGNFPSFFGDDKGNRIGDLRYPQSRSMTRPQPP